MTVVAGRTVQKWAHLVVGGYDLTGYVNQIGAAMWEYDTPGLMALDDAVQGGLPNEVTVSLGEVRGIFDNTATSGLHVALAAGAGSGYIITAIAGMRATIPNQVAYPDGGAVGIPAFCGRFNLLQYRQSGNDGILSAPLKFGGWDAGGLIAYDQPWGSLLVHDDGCTLNAGGTGIASGTGGQTTKGGYMVYHVWGYSGIAGDTATISVDDSADNSSFLALSGCTTGSIDVSTKPSGIVAIGKTATVRQYVRWQVALGTASDVDLTLSFIRGR